MLSTEHLPREILLEQKLAQMQIQLEYLNTQYRARQEDLMILQVTMPPYIICVVRNEQHGSLSIRIIIDRLYVPTKGLGQRIVTILL